MAEAKIAGAFWLGSVILKAIVSNLSGFYVGHWVQCLPLTYCKRRLEAQLEPWVVGYLVIMFRFGEFNPKIPSVVLKCIEIETLKSQELFCAGL